MVFPKSYPITNLNQMQFLNKALIQLNQGFWLDTYHFSDTAGLPRGVTKGISVPLQGGRVVRPVYCHAPTSPHHGRNQEMGELRCPKLFRIVPQVGQGNGFTNFHRSDEFVLSDEEYESQETQQHLSSGQGGKKNLGMDRILSRANTSTLHVFLLLQKQTKIKSFHKGTSRGLGAGETSAMSEKVREVLDKETEAAILISS